MRFAGAEGGVMNRAGCAAWLSIVRGVGAVDEDEVLVTDTLKAATKSAAAESMDRDDFIELYVDMKGRGEEGRAGEGGKGRGGEEGGGEGGGEGERELRKEGGG
jgi:hypothetical protein